LLKILDEQTLNFSYPHVCQLFVKKCSTGNGGVSLLNMFSPNNDEVNNFELFHSNLKDYEKILTNYTSYPSIFTQVILLHNSVKAM